MTYEQRPCDWPIASPPRGEGVEPDPSCVPCAVLEDMPPERIKDFEDMATELLWRWTGKRFGLCETTVRPCRAECADRAATFWGQRGASMPSGGTGWVPVLFAGQWWNIGCGVCGVSCSCEPDTTRTIALPGAVDSIVSIYIDGALLPESAYTLRDGILYRIDGGVWPACNSDLDDPRKPDSSAWEVTYRRGYPVPPGGDMATYRLACELAKAACGDNSCELPSRVKSITRQGVSMDLMETTFAEMQDGRTGIWLIDSWVAAVTVPVSARPRVVSPDISPGRGRGTRAGLGFGNSR